MDKDRLAASVSNVSLHSYGKSEITTLLIRRLILQNIAFRSSLAFFKCEQLKDMLENMFVRTCKHTPS